MTLSFDGGAKVLESFVTVLSSWWRQGPWMPALAVHWFVGPEFLRRGEMIVTMTCFQRFTWHHVCSPAVFCCLWLCGHSRNPDIARFCAQRGACRTVLLVPEFSDVYWRDLVVPHMPWRCRWLSRHTVWMCSSHLSVNLSCLTTLDTAELNASTLVPFMIEIHQEPPYSVVWYCSHLLKCARSVALLVVSDWYVTYTVVRLPATHRIY